MRSFSQHPIWGVQTASSLLETRQLRWGASPPTSIDGFPGGNRPFVPPKSDLRQTSQRVGTLPGALLFMATHRRLPALKQRILELLGRPYGSTKMALGPAHGRQRQGPVKDPACRGGPGHDATPTSAPSLYVPGLWPHTHTPISSPSTAGPLATTQPTGFLKTRPKRWF